MPFSKILIRIIVISLFISLLGTGYIFITSFFFNDKTYTGFFNNWQFPMILAVFAHSFQSF